MALGKHKFREGSALMPPQQERRALQTLPRRKIGGGKVDTQGGITVIDEREQLLRLSTVTNGLDRQLVSAQNGNPKAVHRFTRSGNDTSAFMTFLNGGEYKPRKQGPSYEITGARPAKPLPLWERIMAVKSDLEEKNKRLFALKAKLDAGHHKQDVDALYIKQGLDSDLSEADVFKQYQDTLIEKLNGEESFVAAQRQKLAQIRKELDSARAKNPEKAEEYEAHVSWLDHLEDTLCDKTVRRAKYLANMAASLSYKDCAPAADSAEPEHQPASEPESAPAPAPDSTAENTLAEVSVLTVPDKALDALGRPIKAISLSAETITPIFMQKATLFEKCLNGLKRLFGRSASGSSTYFERQEINQPKLRRTEPVDLSLSSSPNLDIAA